MMPASQALAPRLMTRAEAAAYCHVTPEGFTLWVNKGIVPGPIPGTIRWDRKAIDAALDKHSGLVPQSAPASAFDAWKAGENARQT